MPFNETLTPNAQQLDFSRTNYTQTVTLTGGTDDLVGWFSDLSDSDQIAFQLKNVSGAALTAFKMQVRMGPDFGWQTVLSGADWTSSTNPLLRRVNTTDPTTLAVGAESFGCEYALGAPQVRFVATGTVGTILQISAKAHSYTR